MATWLEDLKWRFWSKVDWSGGSEACWWWKAAKFQDGYGMIRCAIPTEKNPEVACRKASRVAWILTYGPIQPTPKRMVVMHTCDQRACVNPAHLRLGTSAANSADMVAKERQSRGDAHYARHSPERLARGSKVGTAKLSEDQVREILTVYASWPKDDRTGKPLRGALQQIADRFKVSRQLIWQIVNGKWWSHVEVRMSPELIVRGVCGQWSRSCERK